MATAAVEHWTATWAEYEALGPDVRAEYIDGEIIVTPLPSEDHQTISRRLANLIEAVLPLEYKVNESWGWKPGADEFGPDVMVYSRAERTTGTRFTGTPVLCVEVLSGNWTNDFVTKMNKYAEAGRPHYWIVDPVNKTLAVLALEAGRYRVVGHLSAQQEPRDVSLGIASMTIDLDALTAD